MKNIQKVSTKIHALTDEYIKPKLRQRFLDGIKGLSLSEFHSLNGNGRLLAANPKAGQQRLYRTSHDARFTGIIQQLILEQFLPKSGILHLSLDHSQFGQFYIAVLALSVGRGRSLPLWCQVGFRDRALMRPLIRALTLLFNVLGEDTRRILLTMDRWFASPKLLPFLDGYGVNFICRIKSDLPVMVSWDPYRTVLAGQISHEELEVEYAGLELRLVRSDYREGMKQKEPWFLLTNTAPEQLSRQQILNYYAKRFEIEEFFKDIKWVQRYEWTQIKQPDVIQAVLSFAFLGWWLIYDCLQPIVRASRSRIIHPKRRLSWFKACWETLQREIHQEAFAILSG